MKEVFTREEAVKEIRKLGRLFGLIFYLVSNLLIEELGAEQGKVLIKEIIKRYGLDRALQVRETVVAMGLEPTLENYQMGADLPSIG